MTSVPHITPPRSWLDPESHYLKAMESDWYSALLVLQDCVSTSTQQFWSERGVLVGNLPVTTGSISSPMGLGSDSSPVMVRMFDVDTFLADSMQFGLEYLCRLSPNGAYYMMPSFRGEAADATHLCQFFHSEAEIPGGLDEVMTVVEQYVRRLVTDLVQQQREVLARFNGGDLSHLDRVLRDGTPFQRMTFDEAAELLHHDPRFVAVCGESEWRTLTRSGERELMTQRGEFIWITDWDSLAVPFYQARHPVTGKSRNADLLFGPGEVVGAGERHRTSEDVIEALRTHQVPIDAYRWYVSMKEKAPLRTSGFGLGVERFLMWLLRSEDIRDLQLFVRENGRDIVP
jgi:asparaginyl-tRNA synthetase